MCAKTPMSANEKGLAETGRHGEDVSVSANGCHTESLGTHAQFGTHGEGGTPATGPLWQDGEPIVEKF